MCFFPLCTGSQGEKEEEEDDDIPSDRKLPKSTLLSKINASTIKTVLELLCDESVSDLHYPEQKQKHASQLPITVQQTFLGGNLNILVLLNV